MKNRNRVIVGLLLAGMLLFALIQFVWIPRSNAEREKYIAAQQDPITHDLSRILPYQNKYMGNASNDANLFANLPLSDVGMDYQLFSDRLELAVNYKGAVGSVGEERVKRSLLYNSTAAFALIGNLKAIDYNFSGASYRVERADVEALYSDFSHILDPENWKNSVQKNLSDRSYVEHAFSKAVQTQSR